MTKVIQREEWEKIELEIIGKFGVGKRKASSS